MTTLALKKPRPAHGMRHPGRAWTVNAAIWVVILLLALVGFIHAH